MRESNFIIRAAVLDDAPAIAEIHYLGWVQAYGQLMTPAQLAEKAVDKRIPVWRDWIVDPQCITLVGCDAAGMVMGFAIGGPVHAHDIIEGGLEGFERELYIIHCYKQVQGQGLGRRLIAALARHFMHGGANSVMLWAFAENAYRRFYDRLGGVVIARGIDDGVPDVAYGWRDLSTLIAACEDK